MLWDLAVLSNISGWVVAFGVVLYDQRKVTKGDLVPRKTHEDTIEERNTWRAAAEAGADTTSLALSQLSEFRAAARSAPAVLQVTATQEASRGSSNGI